MTVERDWFWFGFGFTTPFAWLVYLLWFWFYDSQVKTALIFVFCHKRYIPTAAAFGGLCIGALSVLADFMGEFIEFNLYPPLLTGFLVMGLAL